MSQGMSVTESKLIDNNMELRYSPQLFHFLLFLVCGCFAYMHVYQR